MKALNSMVFFFICTQTGDESIAESCLQTNIPRAQGIFHTGDNNNNITAYYRLRSPCEAADLREGRQEALVGTGHAQVKSNEKKTGRGGGQRPRQKIHNLIKRYDRRENKTTKKIYYILIYLCGLHAGRAKKSVADNVRGQIVYKNFFKFRVKNVWFTNNFDVLIGEVLP